MSEIKDQSAPKFTVAEIKEWLEGWEMVDGSGEHAGYLPIPTVLALLECDQDGIEAWVKRNKG